MGRCYLVKHDFPQALKYFSILTEMGGNAESRGRSGLADLALSQGKYDEAESQLTRGISLDRRNENRFSASMKVLALASVYYDHGRRNKFEPMMIALPNSSQTPLVMFLKGCLRARAHQLSNARMMLHLLKSPGDKFKTRKVYSYIDLLTSEIAMSRGDYKTAIDAAHRALGFDDSTLGVETLARAYEAAGRITDSVHEYERVLMRVNERAEECDGLSFHRAVEANYRLGLLNARRGEFRSSRQYLAAFLNYWSQHDMDAPLYRDALGLLQKLPNGDSGKPTPAA
jgi:tetratricopeptide (TPR) repeat protein